MKLPLKITLLLFLIIIIFVSVNSFYLYRLIDQNFQQQAQQSMEQSTSFLQQQISALRENLEREMNQISTAFFLENEDTIASIFASPRNFNPQVISFAEKLRRRTTLDFLSVIDDNSQIVSDSLQPASYGKPDRHSDFPLDEAAYTFENHAAVVLKKHVQFGHRVLNLRGGYFLMPRLQNISLPGIQITTREMNNNPGDEQDGASDRTVRRQKIQLSDPSGKPVFEMVLSASRRQLDLQKAALVQNSLLFVAGTFVICLLAGYLLSMWISRPVARLTQAAEEMSLGDLSVRVPKQGSGEIASLVDAFNRMAEDLADKQQKLLQAERIAAWQEIARHLAHEIKNPLAPIRTSLANLRLSYERAPEKFPEILKEAGESISEEVEKLRHLADEFSRFARLPAPSPRRANLNEVVQKSIVLYSNGNAPKIHFESGEVSDASFDPEQISQVLHNLLHNAIDASSADGIIQVYTGTSRHQDRDWVFLAVQDHGAGMNEEVRRQVFTPYFTTKEKGTGLGLAIVHRIIQEHKGNILIDSTPGRGTRIEIQLSLT